VAAMNTEPGIFAKIGNSAWTLLTNSAGESMKQGGGIKLVDANGIKETKDASVPKDAAKQDLPNLVPANVPAAPAQKPVEVQQLTQAQIDQLVKTREQELALIATQKADAEFAAKTEDARKAADLKTAQETQAKAEQEKIDKAAKLLVEKEKQAKQEKKDKEDKEKKDKEPKKPVMQRVGAGTGSWVGAFFGLAPRIAGAIGGGIWNFGKGFLWDGGAELLKPVWDLSPVRYGTYTTVVVGAIRAANALRLKWLVSLQDIFNGTVRDDLGNEMKPLVKVWMDDAIITSQVERIKGKNELTAILKQLQEVKTGVCGSGLFGRAKFDTRVNEKIDASIDANTGNYNYEIVRAEMKDFIEIYKNSWANAAYQTLVSGGLNWFGYESTFFEEAATLYVEVKIALHNLEKKALGAPVKIVEAIKMVEAPKPIIDKPVVAEIKRNNVRQWKPWTPSKA
jgi:hypothetical protein